MEGCRPLAAHLVKAETFAVRIIAPFFNVLARIEVRPALAVVMNPLAMGKERPAVAVHGRQLAKGKKMHHNSGQVIGIAGTSGKIQHRDTGNRFTNPHSAGRIGNSRRNAAI